MKSKIILFIFIVFVLIITISSFIKNSVYINNSVIEYTEPDNTTAKVIIPTATPSPTIQPPKTTPAPVLADIKKYNPDEVFFDDFNRKTVDVAYWNVLEREKNYNRELQAYVRENVYTEDGCLVLVADKTDDTYQSGHINTHNKVDFKYGTVTVRLKYPTGKSFFPAIWLLPSDYSALPEIDIMEVLGHEPNRIYLVYHYYSERKKVFYNTMFLDDYEDFHTYQLVWTPESLVWYVDYQQVLKITENIPDKKMYLIINFAIGGSWPGFPDKNTKFPSKVLVDYVRITPYEPENEEHLYACY